MRAGKGLIDGRAGDRSTSAKATGGPRLGRPPARRNPLASPDFLQTDRGMSAATPVAPAPLPIATTLRYQGLRVGEVLRLEWPHVNWSTNSLFVAETKNGEPRTNAGAAQRREFHGQLQRRGFERCAGHAGMVSLDCTLTAAFCEFFRVPESAS